MRNSDLDNLIKSRRSIRVWQDKPVSEQTLLDAIELATYAPNAGNQQNWKFYIILNRDVIRSIADAVQKSANYIASFPEIDTGSEAVIGMLKRSGSFGNAPAAIAIAASQYQSPIDQILASKEKTDARASEMRQWRNSVNAKIQSVSSAIAFLLLVLHQKGLGAVWMTGPMQAKGEIEKILKVPNEMDVVALIPLGYPAEAPPLKLRKPVKEVTEVIK
jgi:nitroreductase